MQCTSTINAVNSLSIPLCPPHYAPFSNASLRFPYHRNPLYGSPHNLPNVPRAPVFQFLSQQLNSSACSPSAILPHLCCPSPPFQECPCSGSCVFHEECSICTSSSPPAAPPPRSMPVTLLWREFWGLKACWKKCVLRAEGTIWRTGIQILLVHLPTWGRFSTPGTQNLYYMTTHGTKPTMLKTQRYTM